MYFWDFCVHPYTVDANRVSSVVLMELKTNKQKTNKKKTVTTVFVESILVAASENFHTSRSISYFFGEKCLLIKIFCATNVSPDVYTTVHAHLVGGISYLANKTKCTCLNVKNKSVPGFYLDAGHTKIKKLCVIWNFCFPLWVCHLWRPSGPITC